MPNLYLVGMMGAGKSVTGKKLAAFLNLPFTDLDEAVQEKTGRTIADIFTKEGESFFREQETAVLNEFSAKEPRVIAAGGGTVLRDENVERMKKTGKIIYLETSLEVLWQRVKGRSERPLLVQGEPKDNLTRIFNIRRPIYEKVSDMKVGTDGQSAEAVAQKILIELKK